MLRIVEHRTVKLAGGALRGHANVGDAGIVGAEVVGKYVQLIDRLERRFTGGGVAKDTAV